MGERGEFRDEAADIVGGGVVGAADAEQDLVLRVVLHGMRADGFVEVRIAAVHGLQDGDREAGRQGLGRPAKPPAPPDGRDDGQQPVGRRSERGDGQPDHSESSATPQATSDAPAQRSKVTGSCNRYLASTVSST
jgi:hypothetical protein